MIASPRCGKPVRPYEVPGAPVLEQPECGRPADHNGRCRSVAAVSRALASMAAKRDHLQALQNERRHALRSSAPVSQERAA